MSMSTLSMVQAICYLDLLPSAMDCCRLCRLPYGLHTLNIASGSCLAFGNVLSLNHVSLVKIPFHSRRAPRHVAVCFAVASVTK